MDGWCRAGEGERANVASETDHQWAVAGDDLSAQAQRARQATSR
jgi:hypothetical protein